MSTKFAVRPAPRKRPWICKRSPPCLPAPTTPPSVLCSFSVQKYYPPPVGATFAGSMMMPWRPMLGLWKNSFVMGGNGFTCDYSYDLTSGSARASAEWDVDSFLDWGIFIRSNAGAWPWMFYQGRVAQFVNYLWNVDVVITA